MFDDPLPTDARRDGADDGAHWDAIVRSLSGGSDPALTSSAELRADSALAQAWLSANPADAALLEIINTTGANDPTLSISVDVEAALTRVRARIDGGRDATVISLNTARPLRAAGHADGWYTHRRGGGLAAAALVLLAIGFGTRRTAPGRGVTTNGRVVNGATTQVYSTRVGIRDSVLLADGSRVVLAPGSRLTVAPDFATRRTVQLEGAAYFTVRHDAARPFTVRSRGAEIRDIGTAFSVNTDAAGAVVVSVTRGAVSMRSSVANAKPVELRAGDRGIVPNVADGVMDGEVAVVRGAVTDDDVSWTRGELIYRDAPLAVVQADLRRWYGLDLQIADASLARRTITASFHADSAPQAVRIIALALGAEMTQRGDTVVLRMGGHGTPP